MISMHEIRKAGQISRSRNRCACRIKSMSGLPAIKRLHLRSNDPQQMESNQVVLQAKVNLHFLLNSLIHSIPL